MGGEDAPSEDMDAPESLNSSLPICMGKTRSRGRMSGILEMVFSVCSPLPAGVNKSPASAWPWPGAPSSGLPCIMVSELGGGGGDGGGYCAGGALSRLPVYRHAPTSADARLGLEMPDWSAPRASRNGRCSAGLVTLGRRCAPCWMGDIQYVGRSRRNQSWVSRVRARLEREEWRMVGAQNEGGQVLTSDVGELDSR